MLGFKVGPTVGIEFGNIENKGSMKPPVRPTWIDGE